MSTKQSQKNKRSRIAGLLIIIGALMPWAAVLSGVAVAVYRIQNPGLGISQDVALMGVWIFVGMMLLGETGHTIRKREARRQAAAAAFPHRPDEDENGEYVPILPPGVQIPSTSVPGASRFVR